MSSYQIQPVDMVGADAVAVGGSCWPYLCSTPQVCLSLDLVSLLGAREEHQARWLAAQLYLSSGILHHSNREKRAKHAELQILVQVKL